jgi:hypothetical protein
VAEVCDGIHPTCPADLRNDLAYTFKCGIDQYLCGVDTTDLVLLNSVSKIYALGGCNMGTAKGSLFDLFWPQCLGECIPKRCRNGREPSNYVMARCNPLTGSWNCTLKVNLVEPYPEPCPYL